MNKGLIGLIFIALLVLFVFVIGCKAPTKGRGVGEEQVPGEGGEEAGGVTEQPHLTREITEVDNLSSELNDPELDNTEAYLDELNW